MSPAGLPGLSSPSMCSAPAAAAGRTLVVGFGNPLRRDDGVGPFVAECLARRRLPGVQTLAVHQLTPELAERLAACQLAVFVDARRQRRGGVERSRIERPAAAGGGALTHAASPQRLLELARQLYGTAPHAFLVTIPGHDFAFGEGLSPTTRRAAQLADRQIAAWIGARDAGLGTRDSGLGNRDS